MNITQKIISAIKEEDDKGLYIGELIFITGYEEYEIKDALKTMIMAYQIKELCGDGGRKKYDLVG